MDLFLDQAGGCAGPGHAGGHLSVDPLHPARQVAVGAAAGLLRQVHRQLHERLHSVSALRGVRRRAEGRVDGWGVGEG